MIPYSSGSMPEWQRLVAYNVNPRINGYPHPQFAAAPAAPNEGFTYYDTALHKVRTWDGTIWQNHW